MRLFLTHSSEDDTQAVDLRYWRGGLGWEDVFFDRDPEHGILVGQRCENALIEADRDCEAVVFVISRNHVVPMRYPAFCASLRVLAPFADKHVFALLATVVFALLLAFAWSGQPQSWYRHPLDFVEWCRTTQSNLGQTKALAVLLGAIHLPLAARGFFLPRFHMYGEIYLDCERFGLIAVRLHGLATSCVQTDWCTFEGISRYKEFPPEDNARVGFFDHAYGNGESGQFTTFFPVLQSTAIVSQTATAAAIALLLAIGVFENGSARVLADQSKLSPASPGPSLNLSSNVGASS